MTIVSLAQAEAIIDAIIEKGRQEKLRPLSVVVEPGCIPKAFKKEDGSAMMRFEMAMGKAYASLALGRSSDLVRQRAEHRPMFMAFMLQASEHKIFPEGGGQLIRDADGEVIGAVGVTGDTQEKDDELAAYGIRASGLKTDDDCAGQGKQVRLTRD